MRSTTTITARRATLVGAAPVIRHGLFLTNHSETLVLATPVIRHGLLLQNHNETLVTVARREPPYAAAATTHTR
jgi:hypothetical protein